MTLNDVLLALVGDIGTPEEDTEPDVVRRDDGSWLIDGNVTIGRLKEVTGAEGALPYEDEGRYNTLSGRARSCFDTSRRSETRSKP